MELDEDYETMKDLLSELCIQHGSGTNLTEWEAFQDVLEHLDNMTEKAYWAGVGAGAREPERWLGVL